jgi:glutamate 5-kinase
VTDGQEASVRQALKTARRIVVKVGSRSLAALPDLPSILARQFAALKAEGRSVVLVSSGAVALGAERLGFSGRPTDLGQLQAAASAGQSVLMSRYDDAFLKVGLIPAQVLLTHGDLSNRRRVNNARVALKTLIEAGATPVINENDVVSTEELSFGDNDHLSAMVTPLVDADALVLLTDVSGVLDQAGNSLSYLASFDDFVDRGRTSLVGSGGMASKIGAARKASHAGAAVVIASAFEKDALSQVLAGEKVGSDTPADSRGW